jgi:hypothetical protein
MGLTGKLLIVVALVWAALSPPLFTDGACTAEFDQESARLGHDQADFKVLARSESYWHDRGVPLTVLGVDDCRRAKPRYLARCGDGPLLIARVPVRNTICRLYRDDEIMVRMQYDDHGRLERYVTDMSPYRSLPIPFADITIHWAR